MTDTTPQKIYKYQPFNHYSLINLIKRQFYFSKPENFNDPYDCDPPFKIAKAHRTQKNIKTLYDRIKNSRSDRSTFDMKYLTDEKPNKRFVNDFIESELSIKEQIRSKVGVTCFSKHVNEILLWSHYADMHKGFCLEFDTGVPIMEGQQKTELYEVKYSKSNSYRRLDILDILNKPDVIEVLLTTKSHQWHYEKEWRIFSNDGGNKLYPFNFEALTGVYFGYKMPQEDRDVIASVLKPTLGTDTPSNLATLHMNHLNTRIAGTQINVYEMILNKEKFMISPFHFRPNYRP